VEQENKMIRVLVVEDSPVVREFLVHVLSSDPAIQVIGTACNGEEALEAAGQAKPDLITMDIHMPKMGGLEATRRIMETQPIPIVIVSGSSNAREVATTFHAMEAGAVAFVERPKGIGHPEHEATAAELVTMVKLMAEVKVIRRWSRLRRETLATPVRPPADGRVYAPPEELALVAMGASTGGPLVLQSILAALPADYPVPVLIVQHMAMGFIGGFVEWLAPTAALPIQVATQGQRILAGHAYVAPDGLQMKVERAGVLSLTNDEPENGHRPSVGCLFRSVARAYGPQAAGVLLTGMGKDGAEGLKEMRDRGAVTIAQDADSSVVHGMPGEAIRLEAATYVLPPSRIAAALASLAHNRGAREEQRTAVSAEEDSSFNR